MIYATYLMYLFVFGLAATAVLGLGASWVDRKLTARVQYRVGPPPLQPLTDIVKLLGKETLIPAGASQPIFLLAPVVGLASVVVASALLWMNNARAEEGFLGDLVVALYLLVIPSLSLILGGFASGNPLATLGASREMKLVLAYELPFVLAVAVPVIQADYTLRLDEILAFQHASGVAVVHPSGLLALVVALVCVQAKLGLVPFDAAEAETEIVGGPLIDYSGAALATYRLMKNMLLFTLPFFLMILFLGGWRLQGAGILWGLLKFLGIVAVITVVRNTNPRVRIDHALRFFWGPVALVSLLAVVLAARGW